MRSHMFVPCLRYQYSLAQSGLRCGRDQPSPHSMAAQILFYPFNQLWMLLVEKCQVATGASGLRFETAGIPESQLEAVQCAPGSTPTPLQLHTSKNMPFVVTLPTTSVPTDSSFFVPDSL